MLHCRLLIFFLFVYSFGWLSICLFIFCLFVNLSVTIFVIASILWAISPCWSKNWEFFVNQPLYKNLDISFQTNNPGSSTFLMINLKTKDKHSSGSLHVYEINTYVQINYCFFSLKAINSIFINTSRMCLMIECALR